MPPPIPRKPRKSRAKPKASDPDALPEVVADVHELLVEAAVEQEVQDMEAIYSALPVDEEPIQQYEAYVGVERGEIIEVEVEVVKPDFLTFMIGWLASSVASIFVFSVYNGLSK